MFFDDLAIKITHHHLYCMLLVTGRISDTFGKRLHKHKYQEEGINVSHLRCSPCSDMLWNCLDLTCSIKIPEWLYLMSTFYKIINI